MTAFLTMFCSSQALLEDGNGFEGRDQLRVPVRPNILRFLARFAEENRGMVTVHIGI